MEGNHTCNLERETRCGSVSGHHYILWVCHSNLHIAGRELKIAVLPSRGLHPGEGDRPKARVGKHEGPFDPASEAATPRLGAHHEDPLEDPAFLAKSERSAGSFLASPLKANAAEAGPLERFVSLALHAQTRARS